MTKPERVVVVGTGPAGAAAAVFLSRAGLEPLLLEAGSGTAALGLTARIRGVTVARFKRPLTDRRDLTMTGDPAAKIFEEIAPGGLSNHWACAVPRFSPDDFEDAARAGETYAWPFGYSELAPYYDQIEPLLRIAGSVQSVRGLPAGQVSTPWALAPEWNRVVEEAAMLGRDVVAMPYAFGAGTTMTPSGTPFNAYTRLIRPIERAGGLSVRYDARVLRLVWSPAERRVTEVVVRDARTGSESRVACRAVVLAAGAINSAQILLESASAEFPEGLGNRHRVLGRYFHDHPVAKIVVDLDRSVPIAPASYITRPTLDRSNPLYAAAFMQWASTSARARTGFTGRTRRLGFTIFGTMVPVPEDGIALDRNRPRDGRSSLMVSLNYPREAVQVLEQARADLVTMLTQAGWGPRVAVFHIEPPGQSVHYGGTCRMHATPRFGVVDGYCRVHGVPNVAVADSSVFTTGPEKNPVLTAMALSARAAQKLADDLRTGAA